MFLTNYLLYLFILSTNSRPVPSSTCTLTCDTTCIQCTDFDVSSGIVSLDVSSCKGSSLSWLACADCQSMNECDGTPENMKCNSVTSVSYYVNPNQETIHVQVHDGVMAGNVDCDQEQCFGGSGTSCGTISGVCNFEIPISTCPINDAKPSPSPDDGYDEQSIPCTSDDECISAPCGQGVCVSGFCSILTLPQGTVCRPAIDLCDADDVCDGLSIFCPDEDMKQPNGTVCRASLGLCDIDDTCDGVSDTCSDIKKSNETVCRPAIVGVDGTTCDAPEMCSGLDNDCPNDEFLPANTTCRSRQDLCDVPDTCSGITSACPSDLRKDHAISMKCGDTCYTCGALPSEYTRNRGGASMLGGCTIGKCAKFVALPWPECEYTCATSMCDNNRELSNIAHYNCNKNDGIWGCTDKTDIAASIDIPLCPFWLVGK